MSKKKTLTPLELTKDQAEMILEGLTHVFHEGDTFTWKIRCLLLIKLIAEKFSITSEAIDEMFSEENQLREETRTAAPREKFTALEDLP